MLVCMVPADLHEFMIACLGAAASFIGLLFVGLSVVLQKPGDQKIANTDRLLAESSYAGLINIFFVALVGILPNGSIGTVSLVMGILGLLSCWRLRGLSHIGPLIISGLVYLLEIGFGLNLMLHSKQFVSVSIFQTIIIALFAISLIRAWGLTGIHSKK
jgi:hypothetical protein